MAEILSNNSIVKNAIEQQLNNEQTVEEEKLDFNPLRVYFGDDYIVNDKVDYTSKVGDIGYKFGNLVEGFMNEGLKKILKFLSALFYE